MPPPSQAGADPVQRLVSWMIDQLDLNLLLKLRVLVQTKSVTEAARLLRTSQPAMSRSLAELRRLLGDPLLVRTRGGMILTRRAEELVEPLRAWLDDGLRLVAPQSFDPGRLARRFRMMATDYGVLSVLRPSLWAITAEAPAVAIDVKPFTGDVADRLASGEVDFAVSGLEPDRNSVHVRRLFHDSFMCLTRAGHPLALRTTGEPLGIADLLAWPHISITVDDEDVDPVGRCLRHRGLDRHIIVKTPYFAVAQELLLESDAVVTLPALAARRYARDATLATFAAPAELGEFDYWLLWHNRGHRDPALRWLMGLMARECAADAGAECRQPLLEAAE